MIKVRLLHNEKRYSSEIDSVTTHIHGLQKSFNVTAVGSHHSLQVGPEAGTRSNHGVSVYSAHGVSDGRPERLLAIVTPSVDLVLQNALHKIVEGVAIRRRRRS